MENAIIEILKFTLPTGISLLAVYYIIQGFLNKEAKQRRLELKIKNNEVIAPIRLQAYERICLLLERVTPNNLILRVNNPAMNVQQLQQQLTMEVREEFNHNLSQQVYMSHEAWMLVKNAIEGVINVVNGTARSLNPEAPGIELAKGIFTNLSAAETDPCETAIRFVKQEIQQIF